MPSFGRALAMVLLAAEFANFCTGVFQMRISLKPLLASMYCGRHIFVEANSRLLF